MLKITRAFGAIKRGEQKELVLGNVDAKRDWGHAKDFVRAMWLMLQQDTPDDYVISTGEQTTVREFVTRAAKWHGWNIQWEGEGMHEVGRLADGRVLVRISERYFWPMEVETLLGDCTKARETLGWQQEISFQELVEDMCKSDS